jgi:sugar lactone lactonase YvrE
MADRIRKINSTTGEIHAVVKTGDQLPATASIDGLAVAPNGTLYGVDGALHVVYKIFEDGRVNGAVVGQLSATGDVVSSGLSGSDGNDARLNTPQGVAVDNSGNILIADSTNHKIKRLNSHGRSQTLAGTGASGNVVDDNGLVAQFASPRGITVDEAGIVYVADTGNHRIKKVWPSGKTIVLAGAATGMAAGQGNAAQFASPLDVAVDDQGNIYVADNGNLRIRRIDVDGNVTTVAGGSSGLTDGVGNAAQFASLNNIVMDPSNNLMWVLDVSNSAVRKVWVDGRVKTFASWQSGTIGGASAITIDNSGFLYFLEKNA